MCSSSDTHRAHIPNFVFILQIKWVKHDVQQLHCMPPRMSRVVVVTQANRLPDPIPDLTQTRTQNLKPNPHPHHRMGVWGDWEEPYLTLDPVYEAAQLEVFGTMFLNGHIYRGRKPVHWSPSSQTALAESVRDARLKQPEL